MPILVAESYDNLFPRTMKIFKRILLLLLILIVVAVFYNYPKLNLVSGFVAKNMASTVFLTERSTASVIENDHDELLIGLAETQVDETQKSASATVYGRMERQAIYREGLGAVLINDDFDPNALKLVPKRTREIDTLPFPYGNQGKKDSIFRNIDYDLLKAAMDGAFADPEIQKTRTHWWPIRGILLLSATSTALMSTLLFSVGA